jgi:hypothetical protein
MFKKKKVRKAVSIFQSTKPICIKCITVGLQNTIFQEFNVEPFGYYVQTQNVCYQFQWHLTLQISRNQIHRKKIC